MLNQLTTVTYIKILPVHIQVPLGMQDLACKWYSNLSSIPLIALVSLIAS